MEPNRSEFFRHLSINFGNILYIPARNGYNSPWRFFSPVEAKTLIAIAEQIIPAYDFPGAINANVINFIEKQMVTPYTRFQDDYRKGIPIFYLSARMISILRNVKIAIGRGILLLIIDCLILGI